MRIWHTLRLYTYMILSHFVLDAPFGTYRTNASKIDGNVLVLRTLSHPEP